MLGSQILGATDTNERSKRSSTRNQVRPRAGVCFDGAGPRPRVAALREGSPYPRPTCNEAERVNDAVTVYRPRMLRALHVEGFRGFEKVTVPLGELTAIVGRNSSGKSSLLQAIRMASAAMALAVESAQAAPTLRGSTISACQGLVVSDTSRLSSLSDWQQLFTDPISPGKTRLSIRLDFEPTDAITRADVSLLSGRNAQLLLYVTVESATIAKRVSVHPDRSKRRTPALREELLRELPVALFVPAFYGVTPREEHRSLPLVNRSLGSGDQSHIVRNLVARMDGAAFNTLNALLTRTLGARLVSRTSQADAENTETLKVMFKDTNGELELSAAGTGLVALVALFATLESVRSQKGLRQTSMVPIVLLDEPEAHLHPRLQGTVGEELANLARDFGFQLLLATHSVEMINRLGRSRATLLSVDRAKNSVMELVDESATMQALEDFADLEPFTALNMLASRRILFHEGPSDYTYLDACARVHFRSDDTRMAEWRRYVPCPLDGSGNIGSAKVLSVALSSKLFPKLDGDPVRAGLVLDMDYKRTPMLARKPGSGVEIVESVWSRHSIESLFLDPPILAAWIATGFGFDATALELAIREATVSVDEDRALEDFAVDGRTAHYRKADTDHKTFDVATATQKAREDVRSAPWVYQRGKDRAKRILEELRKMAAYKRLRGSLVDIVARVEPSAGDPAALLPPDIRNLLDLLVPGPNQVIRFGKPR